MERAEDQPNALSSNQQPHLAASLILVDRHSQDGPKLLLGRRHGNHVFLPGKFVFPGGRSEPEDEYMQAVGTLACEPARRLRSIASGAAISTPDALALTAVRELFEETGLVLGTRSPVPISAPPETSWVQFAKTGIVPDLSKLHYIARALTPPGYPRRFDTHFFAVDAAEIATMIDGHVHAASELVELRWASIDEIAALDILPVTYFIAIELAQRLRAGLGHHMPVPFFHAQDDRWIRAEF